MNNSNREKMKILHVSPVYYPVVGGHAIHMQKLSEKMAMLGDHVTVFTSRVLSEAELRNRGEKTQKILQAREMINGVDVKRFNVNYSLHDVLFAKADKVRGGCRIRKMVLNDAVETLRLGPVSCGILPEIIKFKPDVVLSLSGYYANTYFCYLAKKFSRFPLVVIPSLHMPRDPSKEFPSPMLGNYLNSAELIIALTHYEKELLIAKGCNSSKISVVGVGVEPCEFSKADGSIFRKKHDLGRNPVIAFVGRRAKGKGIDTLIDAMPIVWKSIPEARLVLAGDKTDIFASIEDARIAELEPEERKKIICIDQFSQEEKPDIFAGCDVFAMPAEGESFGIVYLEAWACKKPVIACRGLAPASFIKDGDDGLLVEYGNKHELASAIIKLLKNNPLREIMGGKGNKKVLENFTWDIVARQIKRHYCDLVNMGASRAIDIK